MLQFRISGRLVFADVVVVVVIVMIFNLSALVRTLLLFGSSELVVLQSLGRSTNREGQWGKLDGSWTDTVGIRALVMGSVGSQNYSESFGRQRRMPQLQTRPQWELLMIGGTWRERENRNSNRR